MRLSVKKALPKRLRCAFSAAKPLVEPLATRVGKALAVAWLSSALLFAPAKSFAETARK